MKTDANAIPSRDEFERAISEVRPLVLHRTERHRSRDLPVRVTMLALGALIIFGGGVSLGGTLASSSSTAPGTITHTLKVACFAAPTSATAFAYINIAARRETAEGSPAANCDRVWDETSEQGSLRAGALFTQQQYEHGLCEAQGRLNCAQAVITPPPRVTKPEHWADCAARAGYYVEVGYSAGAESAACAAQGIGTR